MKNTILALLTSLVISLGSFIIYDKYFVQEKSVTCPKCKECNDSNIIENNSNPTNEFNTVTGKELSITYDENQFTLVGISYKNEQEQLIYGTKKLSNMKIKKVKVMSGIITSAEDEEAVIIMQDGSVYGAYFGVSNEELYFAQEKRLKDYKISDIISAYTTLGCGPNEEGCGTTFEVILSDGTTKTINN